MTGRNTTNISKIDKLSINDLIKNLFSMVAFQYQVHEVQHTPVIDRFNGIEDYLIRKGSKKG